LSVFCQVDGGSAGTAVVGYRLAAERNARLSVSLKW
jgi:hypothetical protein